MTIDLETVHAQSLLEMNYPRLPQMWAALHDHPVVRQTDGQWVVADYDLVRELPDDPRLGMQARLPQAEDAPVPGAIGALDAPDHERMRARFMHDFGPPHAPTVVVDTEIAVQEIADARLDTLRGRTRMDVIDDYVHHVPIDTISTMLGLPAADAPWLRGVFVSAMELFARPSAPPEEQATSAAARDEMMRYLMALAAERRAHPGPDLVSGMVATVEGHRPLTDRQVAEHCFEVYSGAFDTTNLSTAATVYRLLREPAWLAEVRADPALVPAAFEEAIRLEGPAMWLLPRVALADIDLGGGVVVPAGATILFANAAASRDPRRFPDPDRFDPRRHDNQHIGFGSGPHYCFGAPLARMMGRVMLETWLRRVESPRLVDDPPPRRPIDGPGTPAGFAHLLVDHDGIGDAPPGRRGHGPGSNAPSASRR